MSEHDKSGRKNVLEKGQNKRAGPSVLIAAASLLGTSLGVSASTPGETFSPGAQATTGQNAVETGSVEQETLLAATVTPKVTVPTPHVSVKVDTNQVKTNQSTNLGTHTHSGANIKKYESHIQKTHTLDSNQIKTPTQ
jgi:hypothetical protein